jgi:predicted nucleic-acid-binding Zn-ribbon protein
MKKTGTCPKCGSSDLIKKATVVDRGHGGSKQPLQVATYKDAEALFFKGEHERPVFAWICVSCGFTELYAESPQDLIQP